MDQQLPVLDWQRLSDRPVAWSLPAYTFAIRDCVWLIAVAGLAAVWGADRWRSMERHGTVSSALAEARAAAEQSQRREILLSEQLRGTRAELAALSAQHEADDAEMANLRREISTLQADSRSGQSVHYTSGRER